MRFLKILVLTFPFFISLFLSTNVFAVEKFTQDVNSHYKVLENGKVKITNTLSIKNKNSESFAQAYVLNLYSLNPENYKAYEQGRELKIVKWADGNNSKLSVEFPDAVAGIGKVRTFVITYEVDSLAIKSGEVWEIFVPKLENADDYKTYNITLEIPLAFGEEAYVSPEPRSTTINGVRIYKFQKDDIKNSGIALGFGEFQVFSFTINYHIENPLSARTTTEIALPPDTPHQKVFYENIYPKPQNVTVDDDGNWIATYALSGREKVDVTVNGSVQIFPKPRKLLTPSPSMLLAYVKPSAYWQSDDPDIKNLAKDLNTPRKIYDFVVSKLDYNYEKVLGIPARSGALAALSDPDNAICTEFTDLFIALARAAGIPAREVNGFAYSENPKLQPLSLVTDVLHSWPEYWDSHEKNWVSVDPTWGQTSGLDYFSKLDLRHFAFVIHGRDSQKPPSAGSYKLGSDPQKDVYVSFGSMPENLYGNIRSVVTPSQKINFSSKNLNVVLENDGFSALYDIAPEITIDGKPVNSTFIPVLPPYGKFVEQVKVPYGFLGLKSPNIMIVKAGRSEVSVPLRDKETIIYQILAVFIFLTTLTSIIYLKFHKNTLKSINEFIQKKIGIFKRKG